MSITLKNIHKADAPAAFIEWVKEKVEGVDEALHQAAHDVPNRSQAIEPYQAAILFALAKQYDRARAKILQIGTRYGYSAAILSLGAPKATITTLDSDRETTNRAKHILRNYGRIECIKSKSWNWLQQVEDNSLHMVFVDGDHEEVERDLPWFEKLKKGGLMLFHDYTPSRFPHVVEAVHALKAEPDLVFVQEGADKGMAGVYKT
jgi:predicted O-methyltransferase YrrM